MRYINLKLNNAPGIIMIKKILYSWMLLSTVLTAVNGQHFRNLDFQQKCDTSKTGLCFWDLSWGGKNSIVPVFLDNKHAIAINGTNENSVGFVEQTALVTDFRNMNMLSISSLIKSENVSGKGAGLNIGLYDSDDVLIATKDMGGFYSVDWVAGTNNWKMLKISIVCPQETRKIKIGMILYGKGTVWFSDFAVLTTPIDDRKPSKLALQYINAACDIIDKNSLVRDSINISALKTTALQIAGPAKKHSDCFLAVNFLLESLRPYGDHHSFFMSSNEVKNWKNEGSQVSKIEFPTCKIMDSCGYIIVPPFHGGNPKQMTAYADSLQAGISQLSNSRIKGWIIDLRSNTGGNMEPMIAGLGPLFSADKLGSLVDVNGQSDAWYYKDGRYYGDGYKGWKVSKPIKLPAVLPIAVLTSNQTGSSGEIVTISFIGNSKTKSFGQSTWGLTTGNGSFELKDGSQIFLASTIMADRNARQYTSSIIPDFPMEDDTTTDMDETIEAAIKWILETK